MVSKLRRLAVDHAALHEELPPNYLFPPEDAHSDDITQLTALLAGPQGTPYSQGLWRLHLKLPEDYPKSPPKATFRTRIWHPNVEESTGAVCVDTLKRDWKSTLTLKDVLITISCLLIYPNPDSALNSTAGALLQENYDAFARQAKLMTSIHAPVPAQMRNEVNEAKLRGEESGTTVPEQEDTLRSLRSRNGARIQSVTMKKKPSIRKETASEDSENTRPPNHHQHHEMIHQQPPSDDENENLATASKENDPTLSPSPVKLAPPLSPRKNAHGKRPLSVLTTSLDLDPFSSTDPDDMELDMDTDTADGMTASERNIAANTTTLGREYHNSNRDRDGSPQRKSPKLSLLNKVRNNPGRLREEIEFDLKIYEDSSDSSPGSGGENHDNLSSTSHYPLSLPKSQQYSSSSSSETAHRIALLTSSISTSNQTSNLLQKPVSATRKVSTSSVKKAKPRIGIRRL